MEKNFEQSLKKCKVEMPHWGVCTIIGVFLFCLFCAGIEAKEIEADPFFVGMELFYYDYKEDVPAPLKSTEYGFLPAVRAEYEQGFDGLPFLAKYLCRFAAGNTTYDGSYQDGTPVQLKTDNLFINIDAQIEYEVNTVTGDTVCLYTGIGYSFWNRGLGGSSPYDERYSWFHVPIGLKKDYVISPEIEIGFDAALLIMFGGRIEIDIYNTMVDLELGNKIGWQIRLPIKYRLDKESILRIIPWYKVSRIGRSNVWEKDGYTVYEPASETNQVGVRICFDFKTNLK